jgi:hypothetical protein
MKREIVEHVAICDNCQRIKAEHQRPAGLLQPLQIPRWKQNEIRMDFIVGSSHSSRLRFYLGSSGPFDQVRPFHTCQD